MSAHAIWQGSSRALNSCPAMLNELKVAIGVLRSETQQLGGEAGKLIEMSNRLEMTFDLILRGESPDDRTPGVPRII